MLRCSRCILTSDFPHIHFDNQGVCNYCHTWDRKWKNFDYQQAEAELITIFEGAKAKKRHYDCLIPYSGGRDSSYVVYLCKNKYGLKPLLVTFNNLFMSRYAIDNIQTMTQLLDVDHVMVTYQQEKLKQFYRAMVKNGGEFCSICAAGINHVRIDFQRRYRITLIISGTSSRVDEQSPFEVNSTHPTYVRKVLLKCGFEAKDVDAFLFRRLDELTVKEKVSMKLFDLDYQVINLPDYLPWKNEEIQHTLEKELKWTTPDKHKDHIDCRFANVKYFLKNKQIPHFIFAQEKMSQLIRDGQMNRSAALEAHKKLLEKEGIVPDELDDFLGFLKLEREDIENRNHLSHLNYITKKDLERSEGLGYQLLSKAWGIYKRIR